MLMFVWLLQDGMRVRCDDNDDVMKIIMKMSVSLTTLWITTTVMMITTMAKAVTLFLFIQTTFCLSDCPIILQSRCAHLCLNRPEAADSRSPQSVVGTALSLEPIDVHL